MIDPPSRRMRDLHNVYYRTDGLMSEGGSNAAAALDRLAGIMARLRNPDGGCAWDLAQDFASIAPYTIEEAYEVADAIERGDLADLADELGDLQLQVVFHARMAEERGAFDLADVIGGIADKMVRRHPHVFAAPADPGAAPADWESIKASERSEKRHVGALAGVAVGLPALTRAEKLQRRAARVGFDWPDASGPRAKVDEELEEADSAAGPDDRVEEVGDLLFAIVNWCRHLDIDAEAALRRANAKFERRFASMEAQAGASFPGLSLSEKEALWLLAKRSVAD